MAAFKGEWLGGPNWIGVKRGSQTGRKGGTHSGSAGKHRHPYHDYCAAAFRNTIPFRVFMGGRWWWRSDVVFADDNRR